MLKKTQFVSCFFISCPLDWNCYFSAWNSSENGGWALKQFSHFIQALICIIILIVLIGGFYVEFVFGKRPCTLCLLTRFCMMGVCVCLLLNLWLGFSLRQTGMAILFAVLGMATSLKQLSFHICGSLFPPPSSSMMGLQLWSWAFVVFLCVIIGLALLFFVANIGDKIQPKRGVLASFCLILLFLVLVINIAIVAKLCRFGSECNF